MEKVEFADCQIAKFVKHAGKAIQMMKNICAL